MWRADSDTLQANKHWYVVFTTQGRIALRKLARNQSATMRVHDYDKRAMCYVLIDTFYAH